MHSRMLLILLASSLFLGCKSLKDVPNIDAPTKLYDVDLAHKVCGISRLESIEPLAYGDADDKSLSVCDGIVGMKVREAQKLIQQIRELQEWKNKHIKNLNLE